MIVVSCWRSCYACAVVWSITIDKMTQLYLARCYHKRRTAGHSIVTIFAWKITAEPVFYRIFFSNVKKDFLKSKAIMTTLAARNRQKPCISCFNSTKEVNRRAYFCEDRCCADQSYKISYVTTSRTLRPLPVSRRLLGVGTTTGSCTW